jgi:hypothetical protein
MLNSFETQGSVTTASMLGRAKQTLSILLTCASLVVSALGACICRHHETKAEEPKLSCHSASHETETAKSDPREPKFDSQCICIREVSPAIFNKSDRKKSDGQKETATPILLPELDRDHFAIISSPASYPDRVSIQSNFHRISAPSRAPPRL